MTDASPESTDAVRQDVEAARTAAAQRLEQRAVGGNLSLDEYAERARALARATTEAEVQVAVRGLGEAAGAVPARRRGRWLVAVFGGTEERGRWRLGSRLRVVAVLGGVTLDLGAAEPEASESVITIVAFLGGAEIIAPPGISIQLSGISILGGKSDERAVDASLPGSPLIRLRIFALLGGVEVKERAQPAA